jgi:tRNA(adenine34) deaminase
MMDNNYYMRQALIQAQQAFEEEEVPIGAVIVLENKIIARAYNQVERLKDCTAHAEIIALTSAFNYLGSKYLMDASIYITVEPCLMCAGALYWSKIGTIIYGADDEKNGYKRITKEVSPFHPKTKLIKNLLQDECRLLMQDFFFRKRK